MQLIERDKTFWVGKTISKIESNGLPIKSLLMVDELEIHFTDGSTLYLSTDWRGRDCYISEYES